MSRAIVLSLFLLVSAFGSSAARADMPARRSGPFRSCGSGLAGIGAAWAMLWLGGRVAGRVRTENRDRAG